MQLLVVGKPGLANQQQLPLRRRAAQQRRLFVDACRRGQRLHQQFVGRGRQRVGQHHFRQIGRHFREQERIGAQPDLFPQPGRQPLDEIGDFRAVQGGYQLGEVARLAACPQPCQAGLDQQEPLLQ